MADYRKVQRLVERYDRAVDGVESEVIARIEAAMDASMRQIEAELRRTYPLLQGEGALTAFVLNLEKYQQLKALLNNLLPEAERTNIEQLYANALQEVSRGGAELASELIGTIDPSFDLTPFSGIPVEALVAQARDGVRRLYRHPIDFATRASAIVEQGLIRGHGTAKVARQLRGELGTTKSKAETVARTEVMSAYGQSSLARYQDAGLSLATWLVTLSEGLCVYCAARNGRTYRIRDIKYPLHARDRCVLLPASEEWKEQGLSDEAFLADYRQQGLDELKAQGLTPNYGVAPFERSAGLTEAPKPVWSPGETVKPPEVVEVAWQDFFEEELKTFRDIDGGKKSQQLNKSIEKVEAELEQLMQRAQSTRLEPKEYGRLASLDAKLERLRRQRVDDLAKARERIEARALEYVTMRRQEDQAAEFQKHGMPEAQTMTPVLFSGLKIYDSPEGQAFLIADLIRSKAWGSAQAVSLMRHTQAIYLAKGRNKADPTWARRYGRKDFFSVATGGDGEVTFYLIEGKVNPRQQFRHSTLATNFDFSGTVYHEAGHNLATDRYGTPSPPPESDFGSLKTQAPTSYGQENRAEDFAESVRLYMEGELVFADPERHKIIDRMLKDEAYDG